MSTTCKTIAVYNFKGGVGKTSTTFHVAQSWAQHFKVLVIDCDPQANLTYSFTGNEEHDETLYSICRSYLHNGQPLINPVQFSPYLHLIPGDFSMVTLESNNKFLAFGESVFQRLLDTVRQHYDIILLDCPTHFGMTVQSALANADSILIPASPDQFSISGFEMLIEYLERIKCERSLNILGLFFNQYRKFTLLHQRVYKEAKEKLGHLVFEQTVRSSIQVSESNESLSSYSFPEKNSVIEDYLALSEEIIERLHVSYLDNVHEQLQQA